MPAGAASWECLNQSRPRRTSCCGERSNLYTASEQSMAIKNLPSDAATAEKVDQSGHVLEISPVSSGTVHLNLAKYLQPLAMSVRVYDPTNIPVVATGGVVNAYGGNAYATK